MTIQRVWKRGAVALAVLSVAGAVGGVLAGCGGGYDDATATQPNALTTQTTGANGADTPAPATADSPADPSAAMTPPGMASCPQTLPLVAGHDLTGLEVGEGPPSTSCVTNGAGQRFFEIDVAPGTMAIVRAWPTDDSPDTWLVVRVLEECQSRTCEQVHDSTAPGIYAQATLHNPGTTSLHRFVSVSGMSAQERGRYDMRVELWPEE